MNIGDDWFTKNMLVNTLSRTGKLQSQMMGTTSNVDNLFATVLNQLLMKLDLQSTDTIQTTSSVPEWVTATNEYRSDESVPLKSDKPLRFQESSSDKLNQVLGGKLTGMGDVFVSAGKRYNVNPALLISIAQHETGNGKSYAAINKNNVAGMMGVNGLKSYSSVEDSIMDMARNLSKNYIGTGLTTISKIGAKYAPIGADNDPNGLNNQWVTGVTKFFDRLRV
ncbi:glucosaminidase domain-containing protein [Neobacillus drentensis]|uniref:glucosaminidase domain-containing protein n=1 Tax=Neobacillus drentensis TaxID=220684 RepID=UPI00285781B1|nr:glucosaminidase domain-containing protein [Neobacillus drentensis]MDR7235713.1 beta-N-acetylglucosaminidase [Neobacillus drentensis]